MTTPRTRYNRLRGAYECSRCLGTGLEPPTAPAGEVDRTAIDRPMDELDAIAAHRKAARVGLADIDPAPLPELVRLDAVAARQREHLGHLDP